ncbi:uncharacterized protein LOC110465749 [Mizuhopecten yessoensis]|uniref:ShKT domain-containing protein n=1 Tax=Mizuhopecten yessoensis TaxID=6573 RepID=A0A210PQZ8_MIZYE|nr:uncharacterized protein LOC110465749 [Mizuhopecten yessoensis]OWF38884.1 hypothetical protein KP79_PYT23647 [Mizuhopecten yessoensis]
MVPSNYSPILSVLSTVLLFGGVFSNGKVCYECYHMSHPRDCNNVVECGSHQVCYVNRYVTSDAHVYYNSGCLSYNSCYSHHGRRESEPASNTKVDVTATGIRRNNPASHPDCSSCCHHDFCNTNLCETHKVNSTKKRCMSCDSVEHLSDCQTVRGCDEDEMCYTSYYLHTFGEKRFRLGCMRNNTCNQGGAVHIGETQFCSKCCIGENCNRELCKDAATPPPITTPGTTTLVCEDDPNRPCIPSLLPTICADSVFRNFCMKSCGLCGGGFIGQTSPGVTTSITSAPVSTTAPVVTTVVTAMTSSTAATTGCQDSNQQSCAFEILPIVCFDDIMKFYCRKSCNICDLVVPPTSACVDTHPTQCNNQTMLTSICADKELADLFCQKSCGMCQGATSPATTTCKDDDTRCFSIPFLSMACSDPNQKHLCRQSCSVCT